LSWCGPDDEDDDDEKDVTEVRRGVTTFIIVLSRGVDDRELECLHASYL